MDKKITKEQLKKWLQRNKKEKELLADIIKRYNESDSANTWFSWYDESEIIQRIIEQMKLSFYLVDDITRDIEGYQLNLCAYQPCGKDKLCREIIIAFDVSPDLDDESIFIDWCVYWNNEIIENFN